MWIHLACLEHTQLMPYQITLDYNYVPPNINSLQKLFSPITYISITLHYSIYNPVVIANTCTYQIKVCEMSRSFITQQPLAIFTNITFLNSI